MRKMIDLLSIVADSFLGKAVGFLAKKLGELNKKRKNKRIFQNWIDFYKRQTCK